MPVLRESIIAQIEPETDIVSGLYATDMCIDEEVFQIIISSFPSVPPESGGILGIKDGIICAYRHDAKIQRTDRATYSPDIQWMNGVIQGWALSGIEFAGIVHSHPTDCTTLSTPDQAYIREIMNAMPSHFSELYFPIIIPGQAIYAYIARIFRGTVTIEPDSITRRKL